MLVSLSELIIEHRSHLPELRLLTLEPSLQEISGSIEGEELFIQNELHISRGMRKLHLEIAIIGEEMQILHCVFFPDPCFDLPIFGVDLVVGSIGVTAAIVDLSPVGDDLPESILQLMKDINWPMFSQSRELPDWGKIFSKYVQFIRPSGLKEENQFLELVDQYLKILVKTLASTSPCSPFSLTTIERHRQQVEYCVQQKRNDKTRNVLAKAFNSAWADRYLNEILFDEPVQL